MSRKLNAATSETLPDSELDMSPMIDMVFLLIIFFMVTAKIIKYKIDPKVIIPVGDNAQHSKSPVPTRIIINLYENQEVKDHELKILADSGAIFDYITRKKNAAGPPGTKCQIFLRGDKRVNLEQAKRIIKQAGLAGVTDIVFASLPKAQ